MIEKYGLWVIAESVGGTLTQGSCELISKGRELAEEKSLQLAAVLIGQCLDGLAAQAAEYGADITILTEDAVFAPYQPEPYVLVLSELARQFEPRIVLFSATLLGGEIAPAVAARLDKGLTAHSAGLYFNQAGDLVSLIPAFAENSFSEITCPNNFPQMASVTPGVFEARPYPRPEAIHIVRADELLGAGYRPPFQVTGITEQSDNGTELTSARIVLLGGYGLGGKENWRKMCHLADLLHAGVGCTRPVLDAGWTEDEKSMVGLSGVIIKPALYIGFGVSGNTHHAVGMKDAGIIININTDKNAPAFSISDYIVPMDAGKMLDALLATVIDPV